MALQDFINPFTFIPHAGAPIRNAAPAGHLSLCKGRLTGSLTLRLRARTPVLVGGFADATGSHDLPRRVDGQVMLPGAGVHGAVRALHEVLAGGCLRVLNSEYLPVHRQGAFAHVTRNLVMAVVVSVDAEGLPTEVALCTDTVWVAHELLLEGYAESAFRTGDQISFPERAVEEDTAGRRKLRRAEPGRRGIEPQELVRTGRLGAAAPGARVLMVTDTRPRTGQQAWFAAAQVGADRWAVTAAARNGLKAALQGVDDRRPAHERDDPTGVPAAGPAPVAGAEESPRFVSVHWPPARERGARPGPVVGERLLVTGRLHVGQPVWVKTGRTETGTAAITEVRLSQIWRKQGEHSVGERVHGGGPCRDLANDKLCQSCRIFGSVDPTGREDDEQSRQLSYRGHVRFEDAVAADEVSPLSWDLAPLASPKPSAGQFYLDNAGLAGGGRAAAHGKDPLADWGSDADTGAEPRTIRGRKLYWRTEPPVASGERVRTRGHRRGHHTDEMGARTVQLVPPGTEFTTTVTFENLTTIEVGSLVAAITPTSIWPGTDVVISVGGGKPFGFGSMSSTVEAFEIQSAAMRYLGEDGDVPTLEDCVATFIQNADTVAGPAVTAQWPALRNALTLGFVQDDLVWYPPGEGVRGTPEYDRGFDFWKHSNGSRVSFTKRGVKYLEERRLVAPASPVHPASEQTLRLDVVTAPAPQDDGKPNGQRSTGTGPRGNSSRKQQR